MTRLILAAKACLAVLLLQCFVVGSLSAQGPWDVEVLEAGVPQTLGAGETTAVRLTLRNNGTEKWDPGDGFAVAAHWLTSDGDRVLWEGVRTPLPEVVQPGAVAAVDATLLAPKETGNFVVQWDVLQEGVFWVSDRDPTATKGAEIRVRRDYSFLQLEVDQAHFGWAGSTTRARLVLRNDGEVTWDADGTFGVVGHWRRAGSEVQTMDGPRTRISTAVKPGEQIEISGVLNVPRAPGPWLLEWDVVREGVCFFSKRMDRRPRASLIVVVPKISEAWLCVVLTGLIILGARLNAGPLRHLTGRADLVWLVLVPFAVERSVVEVGFGGGVVTFFALSAFAAVIALAGSRIRPWLAWIGGLFLIVFFVGDRIYLRFFVDLPSVGSFDTMGQTDEIGRSIVSLVNASEVAYLLAGLAGAFVAMKVKVVAGSFGRRAVAALLICATAGCGLWWAAKLPIHRQVFRRVFVARETGVLAAHLLDIGRAVRNRVRHRTVSNDDVVRIETWFEDTADERSGTGPAFGSARGMNLVMVQAESVQAFVIGLEVGGRLVMPNLTRWATEGLWFSEVTDQTGHGRSSDAELISQTSLLPLADGAAAFQTVTNHYTSLAGVLADRGYQTISAVPFEAAFWNRGISHRAYGYETSLFAPDFDPGRRIGWGLGDRDFLSQMGDRLVELPQPFCAWMLTLSLHHPFEGFPDDLEELDVGHWGGGPVGEYLHTMHYLDQALGDLEGRLGSAGLLDRTVIAVWGDHDAGFEWRPEIAELMGVPADQRGWYRSQKVPLVLKTPESLGLAGRIDNPAGHLDIAPTVAGLLGFDGSEFAWMGRNLLGNPGDQPVVGEYDCWTTRTRIFLQGDDGTLEGGRCLDRTTLERLPAGDCGEAFQAARDRIAVSQDVLRYDLQKRVTTLMATSDR